MTSRKRFISSVLMAFFVATFNIINDGWAGAPQDGDHSPSETTDKIEDFGVTWKFEQPTHSGRFANGHYWVLGPVTITSITPVYDGAQNGWEVNPVEMVSQGFDARIYNFDGSLVPKLPYRASGGQSLVKVVSLAPYSLDECRPCIKSASVLTVLDRIPPDHGRTVFRPPYFGNKKPIIAATNLRTDLLPRLGPTKSAPSFEEIAERYKMIQLDHKAGWTGEYIHPEDGMPHYGSDIGSTNAASLLALMLEGDISAKWNGLVRYINNGIDIYYMFLQGVDWPANGGHGEGRKLPAVFAAVMLDDKAMANSLRTANRNTFAETGGMYTSKLTGVVLFGQIEASEEEYWRSVVFSTGARTIIDPYYLIDGGERPGLSYQHCCTAKSWKATTTALLLMPSLRTVFNGEELIKYIDRWTHSGALTQPDQCAPATGVCAGGDNPGTACTTGNEETACKGNNAVCNLEVRWGDDYGKLYGPDGQGSCISDKDKTDSIGRFPQLHNSSIDAGYHGDDFADEMWAKHVTLSQ